MSVEPVKGAILEGRIRLEEHLGAGGYCSVWRARDLESGQIVAAKILHARHRASSVVRDRFRQEARLLGQLSHPAITRAFDAMLDADPPFFTLEYVAGETLHDHLLRRSERGEPMPLATAGWLCGQIAAALAHAHSRSVLHRDLKPANVMLGSSMARPLIKLLDLGAAKAIDRRDLDTTTFGRVVGSTAYLAPEQLQSHPIDGRVDQFALATTMYEVLTLRRAWDVDSAGAPLAYHAEPGPGSSQLDTLNRILQAPRPRVSEVRRDVPSAIDAVLIRAMAVEPADRYPSIDAFRDAFDEARSELSALLGSPALEDTLDDRAQAALQARLRVKAAQTAVNERVDLEATIEEPLFEKA